MKFVILLFLFLAKSLLLVIISYVYCFNITDSLLLEDYKLRGKWNTVHYLTIKNEEIYSLWIVNELKIYRNFYVY
jgi:hypothetical protein